jgi:DNA-binding CsgD family transcriptional regulator
MMNAKPSYEALEQRVTELEQIVARWTTNNRNFRNKSGYHQAKRVESALETLNDQLERRIEERTVNVKELILPYLDKLKRENFRNRQKTYLEILESNLSAIISPFERTLSSKFIKLTPAEIQVANLIKLGKTSKEIAVLSNLSFKTIEFHRNNIRAKLGLKHKKVNLRTHLLSLE